MAKKLNKPRNILLFQNLYPINLYISDIDNWDEITQFFDFFLTINIFKMKINVKHQINQIMH